MTISIAPPPEPRVYASLAAAESGVTAMIAAGWRIAAVRAGADGTLRVKSASGETVDLPFLEGETQTFELTGVAETGSSGCVPLVVGFTR